MFLMSICDNFDQLFVHSSSPIKGHPILYRPIYKKKRMLTHSQFLLFHNHEINYMEKEVGNEEIDCNNEFSFFYTNVFLP